MSKGIVLIHFILVLLSCSNNIDYESQFRNRKKIDEIKYEDGKLFENQYLLDSFDKVTNTYFDYAFFRYYKNGKLKEKGFQGRYKEIGTSVGRWEEYNRDGNLIKKTIFHNDTFGRDYILIEYYKNMKLYKIERYNNYILYENEQVLQQSELKN